MEIDATERGSRTKTCYACGQLGHLKRNCTKGAGEVIKWVEVIDEVEESRIDHDTLS